MSFPQVSLLSSRSFSEQLNLTWVLMTILETNYRSTELSRIILICKRAVYFLLGPALVTVRHQARQPVRSCWYPAQDPLGNLSPFVPPPPPLPFCVLLLTRQSATRLGRWWSLVQLLCPDMQTSREPECVHIPRAALRGCGWLVQDYESPALCPLLNV